jgi:signal transduction histidine kinase
MLRQPLEAIRIVDWRVRNLSLAQQYLVASFLVLVANMLVIGWWIGQQIEQGVLHRTAAATALYVDSFIEPLLQPLAQATDLTPEERASFDHLLTDTGLGQQVVAFKIWGHGRVLYSMDESAIGKSFPPSPGLVSAWNGEVTADISDLDEEENVTERGRWNRLMEIYSPVRQSGTSRIIAVAEFYQPLDPLEGEIAETRLRSWGVVAAGTLLMYIVLAGLVQRGSNTIRRQQSELRAHVAQLNALLVRNAELHHRVQRAARRTTELNEQYLRRISAELHDGPAQELALALLRIDSLAAPDGVAVGASPSSPRSVDSELDRIQTSLTQALEEMRAIAAGLRLPALEKLSFAETVQRVVQNHERRTDSRVDIEIGPVPEPAPLPTKITAYRLIQEALSNAYRHGGGAAQVVTVSAIGEELEIKISDGGPGFDVSMPPADGHLGLAGMRERVESQGGTFDVRSRPGDGTSVRVLLPLAGEDDFD